MTTILVATDFTANSHWATDYALELACQLQVRLVLVHAYDPLPDTNPAPNGASSTAEGPDYRALQQLNQVRNQMLGATNHPVDISVVARPGSPVFSLVDEAARQKADLLVMGIVGDEPLKARRLGSLATELIPYTQVPMLLVPPGSCFHTVQNIVLTIDLSHPVDSLALANAKQFAQLLKATLDIICMEDEPDEHLHKAAERIRVLLSDQPHTFSFLPGNDLILVLDDYFAEHNADLIILLPKPHSRLRTFLLESNTQAVTRLATVPVLAAV